MTTDVEQLQLAVTNVPKSRTDGISNSIRGVGSHPGRPSRVLPCLRTRNAHPSFVERDVGVRLQHGVAGLRRAGGCLRRPVALQRPCSPHSRLPHRQQPGERSREPRPHHLSCTRPRGHERHRRQVVEMPSKLIHTLAPCSRGAVRLGWIWLARPEVGCFDRPPISNAVLHSAITDFHPVVPLFNASRAARSARHTSSHAALG